MENCSACSNRYGIKKVEVIRALKNNLCFISSPLVIKLKIFTLDRDNRFLVAPNAILIKNPLRKIVLFNPSGSRGARERAGVAKVKTWKKKKKASSMQEINNQV